MNLSYALVMYLMGNCGTERFMPPSCLWCLHYCCWWWWWCEGMLVGILAKETVTSKPTSHFATAHLAWKGSECLVFLSALREACALSQWCVW